MIASKHVQGFFPLILILVGLGAGIKMLNSAKASQIQVLNGLKEQQVALDQSMDRHDVEIRREGASLEEMESFYQAWVPEIQKCQDSDALIAGILVEAYQLDLVPMKKEVHNDIKTTFRGKKGSLDRIELSVSGRYDRLVRFVDGLRRNYPFLRAEKLGFSVNESTVLLTMVLSACKLEVPDTDLQEWLALDELENGKFAGGTNGDA